MSNTGVMNEDASSGSRTISVEKNTKAGFWSQRSRKGKLLIIAAALLVIVGLALGLGLGLGLRKKSDDDSGGSSTDTGGDQDNNPDLSLQPIAATPADNEKIWRPKPGTTIQIVLLNPIYLPSDSTTTIPDVEAFDIDLFNNPKETIDTLHRLGKKAICYFSAGSYEPNRPDSSQFKPADMGKPLKGWEDEKWLNLSSPNVHDIMSKRMQLAASKGCDAVDPDNMDAYSNTNGLGMTPQDSINFMGFLSAQAATLNMAIGLKNAGKIITQVLPGVQFSVNEQCVQYSDCQTYSAFINDSKPVFEIEYPSEVKPSVAAEFCQTTGQAQGRANFTTLIAPLKLNGTVKYCNGQTYTTPTIVSNN